MSEDLLDFDVNGEIISVIKRHRANTATLAREIVMTGHQLDEAQTTIEALRAELEAAKAELQQAREAKDGAYRERDMLVAALSKIFPASLERHPDNEKWEDDWRWIVFIDLPTGQATWHIHDSELPMFDHLPRLQGRKWDGHSTDEKYIRLAALPEPPKEADDL